MCVQRGIGDAVLMGKEKWGDVYVCVQRGIGDAVLMGKEEWGQS